MTVDINNKTGYEVAVKYLKIKENPDRMEELRADFDYETNLMKTLNHPNVVKLLGWASDIKELELHSWNLWPTVDHSLWYSHPWPSY